MPRKTRKEKLAASLHKLQRQLENPSTPEASTQSENIRPEGRISLKGLPKVTFKNERVAIVDIHEYSYIARDLRKILLIAAGAILLEIALSLTLSSNSAKVFLRSIGLEI